MKYSRFFGSFLNSTFAAFLLAFAVSAPSLAGGVEITSFGHSSLLIKGGGKSVLLNPFKSVGCAAGLPEPTASVDYILASSELADEGARTSKGIFFVEPGSYRIGNFQLEGFKAPHDRLGGRRYGFATLWTWNQGGLKFAHLGGSAAPLTVENKVLIGRPDILIIAVGGGAKVYNGEEAANVVKDLKPKVVIPVQYSRDKPAINCDQEGVTPFLEAMKETVVKQVGKSFSLPSKVSEEMTITLMD